MSRIPWPRLLLLWIAGIDLRLTLLAIPPLIPHIHRDLGLSEAAVAVLTGLPVLLFACAATLGSLLISRFDARRAIIFGLLLVGVSSALRGVGPSLAMLFAMTFLMGAGIAIIQPAFPALVYYWAPQHVGLATAVYTNGLLAGEVAGAALTTSLVLPIAGSWPIALAVLAAFPVATAALLWILSPALPVAKEPAARSDWLPDFRSGLTWRLGLLQGGTSIIYFGANTFFPDYLHAVGALHLVAPSLAWLNGGQLPASLVIALFPAWFVGRTTAIQATALLAAGALGLFLLPQEWARFAGAAALGFSNSFAFVLALVFPPLIAERPEDVHRISAGMFTISYSFAFFLPLLGGVAWDLTGAAATSLIPVALGAACLMIAPLGLKTGRREL